MRLSLLSVWSVGLRLYRCRREWDLFNMCLISALYYFGEGDLGTRTLGTNRWQAAEMWSLM